MLQCKSEAQLRREKSMMTMTTRTSSIHRNDTPKTKEQKVQQTTEPHEATEEAAQPAPVVTAAEP